MNLQGVTDTVVDRAIGGAETVLVEHPRWFSRGAGPVARLDVDDQPSDDRDIDWAGIDRAVQAALAGLVKRLRARIPGLKWKVHSYRSTFIKLASYAIFYHADGDDFDPIYVGLSISGEDSPIRISGDISGDETGHVYFDHGCDLTVEAREVTILDAAREVAGRLATEFRVVIEAVIDRHPDSTPR